MQTSHQDSQLRHFLSDDAAVLRQQVSQNHIEFYFHNNLMEITEACLEVLSTVFGHLQRGGDLLVKGR